MSYNYFPCVKGRSINNIRKYLPIFRATLITVCCLCNYICTVVLDAGDRVCLRFWFCLRNSSGNTFSIPVNCINTCLRCQHVDLMHSMWTGRFVVVFDGILGLTFVYAHNWTLKYLLYMLTFRMRINNIVPRRMLRKRVRGILRYLMSSLRIICFLHMFTFLAAFLYLAALLYCE